MNAASSNLPAQAMKDFHGRFWGVVWHCRCSPWYPPAGRGRGRAGRGGSLCSPTTSSLLWFHTPIPPGSGCRRPVDFAGSHHRCIGAFGKESVPKNLPCVYPAFNWSRPSPVSLDPCLFSRTSSSRMTTYQGKFKIASHPISAGKKSVNSHVVEYLGPTILSNSLFPGYIWELKVPLMTQFPVVFIFAVLQKSPSLGGWELRICLRTLM